METPPAGFQHDSGRSRDPEQCECGDRAMYHLEDQTQRSNHTKVIPQVRFVDVHELTGEILPPFCVLIIWHAERQAILNFGR